MGHLAAFSVLLFSGAASMFDATAEDAEAEEMLSCNTNPHFQ